MAMVDDQWKDRRMTSLMIYTHPRPCRWFFSEASESERTSLFTPKAARPGDQSRIFIATLGA